MTAPLDSACVSHGVAAAEAEIAALAAGDAVTLKLLAGSVVITVVDPVVVETMLQAELQRRRQAREAAP